MSKKSDDSGIGLTEDRLDDIEDLDEVYDIMDELELDIDLSGLEDLDATKERMREYIFKMEVGNFKQLVGYYNVTNHMSKILVICKIFFISKTCNSGHPHIAVTCSLRPP